MSTQKILIVLCVLLMCGVIFLFSVRQSLIKKVNSDKDEISELSEKFDALERKYKKLKDEKEELEEQISQLATRSAGGRSFYSYSSSNISGENITEEDIFKSKGTAIVVFRKSGCDYMILENNSGYIVAEWMGGNDPDQGDNIAGTFNSFGTKDFYNVNRSSKSRLWIDDYSLSRDRAMEKINDKCN